MLLTTRHPFHQRRQMAGFWDDMMNTPTIYLDPVDTTMTDAFPVDQSVLDARDAWAQGIGTVPDVINTATADTSSWSFSDILKAGTTVAQEVLKYKATQLPNGANIYTRYDPATGRYITGGNTVMLPATSVTGFINQNLPMLLIGGAVLVALTMKKDKKD